jgi:hypothetical protein
MASIHLEPEPLSSFYEHIALYPENGRFRRFGAYWAKRLHDETSELQVYTSLLNDQIKLWKVLDAMSVLDCPLRVVKEKCPREHPQFETLYKAWDAYDEALKRHGSLFVPVVTA